VASDSISKCLHCGWTGGKRGLSVEGAASARGAAAAAGEAAAVAGEATAAAKEPAAVPEETDSMAGDTESGTGETDAAAGSAAGEAAAVSGEADAMAGGADAAPGGADAGLEELMYRLEELGASHYPQRSPGSANDCPVARLGEGAGLRVVGPCCAQENLGVKKFSAPSKNSSRCSIMCFCLRKINLPHYQKKQYINSYKYCARAGSYHF
jgi:hypothetical protein